MVIPKLDCMLSPFEEKWFLYMLLEVSRDLSQYLIINKIQEI